MQPCNLIKIVSAFALACCATGASAVTLSLIYTGNNPQTAAGDISASVGDVLSFDVVLDTQDRLLLGGGFDLFYDADNLLG